MQARGSFLMGYGNHLRSLQGLLSIGNQGPLSRVEFNGCKEAGALAAPLGLGGCPGFSEQVFWRKCALRDL